MDPRSNTIIIRLSWPRPASCPADECALHKGIVQISQMIRACKRDAMPTTAPKPTHHRADEGVWRSVC